MSEQVISLTNKKQIPMSLPNGVGGMVAIVPHHPGGTEGEHDPHGHTDK